MTGGIGVMRLESTSVQEKGIVFHPVSGNGQMSSGLWKQNQISLTRMDGNMLWIFQG